MQPLLTHTLLPCLHRMAMSGVDVDKLLKSLMLKDMRIQCRGRGLSPAGGKEQLTDRLKEHMIATNDL
jgi:SPIRAL1-like protein